MFLGESYDMIPDELNAEPVNYNEILQDKDAKLRKKDYEIRDKVYTL